MLANDDPKQTCVHGLDREFGHQKMVSLAGTTALAEWQVSVDDSSLIVWEEIVDSPSFPHLTTQYKMHQMTVRAARDAAQQGTGARRTRLQTRRTRRQSAPAGGREWAAVLHVRH
eukprot:3414561-Prymnesium_polylepis.1